MSQVLEDLKAARALISDPANWTQRAYARDSYGHEALPCSSEATSFCALGAVYCITDNVHLRREDALIALYRCSGREGLAAVNDREGHAAVLAVFDQAIANLESAQ